MRDNERWPRSDDRESLKAITFQKLKFELAEGRALRLGLCGILWNFDYVLVVEIFTVEYVFANICDVELGLEPDEFAKSATVKDSSW